MATAHFYLRVSTDNQTLSPEDQAQRCKDHWERHLKPLGVTLGKTYSDLAVSGNVDFSRRPQGSCLNLALAKGDYLVAASMDRCFRNFEDAVVQFEGLRRRGVNLVLLDLLHVGIDMNTPVGEMVARLMMVFAAFERRLMGERTRRSFEARRRKAAKEGRVACFHSRITTPYGFKVEGKGEARRLVRDDECRQIGASILERHESGWSLHAIRIWLLEQQIVSPRKRVVTYPSRDARWLKGGKAPAWSLSQIQAWITKEKKLREQESCQSESPPSV